LAEERARKESLKAESEQIGEEKARLEGEISALVTEEGGLREEISALEQELIALREKWQQCQNRAALLEGQVKALEQAQLTYEACSPAGCVFS